MLHNRVELGKLEGDRVNRFFKASNFENNTKFAKDRTLENMKFTTKFKDARLLLASAEKCVILAGIYSLHQIALEAHREEKGRVTKLVHSLLCSFIRERYSVSETENNLPYVNDEDRDIIIHTLIDVLFRNGEDIYNNYRSDLSNVNFSGCDFSGASLCDAILTEADLSFSVLSDVDMKGVDLSFTNMSGVKIKNVDFRFSKFVFTELVGSHIEESDFSSSDFSYTNLSMAIVDKVNFINVKFLNSRMTGISLTEVNMFGSDLSFAQLGRVSLISDIESKSTYTLVQDKQTSSKETLSREEKGVISGKGKKLIDQFKEKTLAIGGLFHLI